MDTEQKQGLIVNDNGTNELDNAPKDKFNSVFIIILMFGIGVLFPWNAFISAMDYFKIKYPSFPMEFTLPSFYNFPNFIFLFVSIRWGHKFSHFKRLLFGFSLMVFVFIGIPLLDIIPMNNTISMWILLFFASLCGIASAVLFGTIFGLSAMFPPVYTTALMSGNGVAGIIIFVLRSITKASLESGGNPNGPRMSSIIYFSATGLVLILCLVAVFMIKVIPFAKYHMNKNAKSENEDQPLLVDSIDKPKATYGSVLRKLWHHGLSTTFCFLVSLSLFPGLTYKVPALSKGLENGWIGIILVGIFQVIDFVGRTLPKWTMFVTPGMLWPLVLLRAIFFILFPLCVIPLGAPFLNNYWAFVFMILFSFTNGYLGTLGVIYGPMEVEEHEKEIAGNLMSLFLQSGIFLGVHLAIFMLWCVDPNAFYLMFHPIKS